MKLNDTHSSPVVQAALDKADAMVASIGREGAAMNEYSKRVLTTESISDPAGLKKATTTVNQAISGIGKLTPSQAEAARVVAAAIANPNDYARTLATENFSGKTEWANENGYGSASVLATEYFSDQDLAKHISKSIVLNVQVAEQTPYAEKMYRTMIIDPSDTGATFRAKKLRTHRGARHSLFADKARKFEPRNAIDALTDPTILTGDDLALVPFMPEDDSANEHFVDPNVFPPREVEVAGHKVRTSYLNFSQSERNLMALASNPLLIGNNLLNESDEIAEGMALKSILVSVNKKGAAASEKQFMELNVLNMSFSGFDKTPQGDGRETQLSFRKNLFALGADTKDWEGNDIAATQPLDAMKYQLNFEIILNSYVTTNDSIERMTQPQVMVKRVYDAEGQVVSHNKGSVKTLVDNIEIVVEGYEYAATFTNENKRNHGLLADSFWFEENYKIRLGDPITTKTPPNGITVDDSSRLEDLISLVNIRNENLAVTRTLEYTDTLREVVKTIRNDFDNEPAPISGIARHFIRPWMEEDDFDLAALVQSLESVNDVRNARAALVAMLRAQVSVALQRSRYLTALRATSGCADKKPTVLITCDSVTADLLQLWGNTKLLGEDIDCEIVTTNDLRYYPELPEGGHNRRLQWVLSVDGDGDNYQIYNWGTHLWVPPLVSNTQIQREGGVATELTVQPRNLHVVNCPITGLIHVKGLDNWMKVRKSLAIEIAKEVEVTGKVETTDPNPAP